MKRRDALQASGERGFLKILAEEEGLKGTTRLKQLLYDKPAPASKD